jgi:carbamoyltransferase
MGDPRSIEMQSTLNLKIKYRESFRPFAPAVIEEKVHEYFELDRPSPYMLLVADVKKERRKILNDGIYSDLMERLKQERSDIPAITHVDYSARIQTVNRRDNPRFYDIIKAFEDRTGIAVIVNTSFNVRGEPIVCSPQDAYRCFMRTEMDILVMEDRILYKSEQSKWTESKNWHDEFKLD